MKKFALLAATALVSLAASAQNLKFAHVDYSELVQLMPEMDEARATIEAAQQEAETTFNDFYQEYQTKAQQYQQKSSTWTPAIRESKEKELADIQQRLQEFQQSIQQELQQKQNELQAPIVQKASEAVNNLAKAKGFIYVFDVQSLLYVDSAQSYDLTPEARKALNIPDDRTMESLQAELMAKYQQQNAQ
ncbi:MAG: OmpH family outer membrane protein [Bacteroidales bacterium]|nr:OmpH family outer membrane protein [Bacteroidales bacterium]